MSGLKVIRRRITSVKNTKQITRAMKLVSAAKLRKAQDAALGGRRFSAELGGVIAAILAELPGDFSHPLLEKRTEIKKRRIIVVSGERGLCGAYNANVVKAIQASEFGEEALSGKQPAELEFFPVGKQSRTACKRFNWLQMEEATALGEDAAQWPIGQIAEQLVSDYATKKFDELVIYYTKFVSAMTQVVTREVLLPFSFDTSAVDKAREESAKKHGEHGAQEGVSKFDPKPEVMIVRLFPFWLGTKVQQAGLEAKASEHAARMTAMDSATRNADELINKLRLFYNRARQSAITRELIDIVGGAEAIK